MLKHEITFTVRLPEPPDEETRNRLATAGVIFPDASATTSNETTLTVEGPDDQSEAVAQLQHQLHKLAVSAEVQAITTRLVG